MQWPGGAVGPAFDPLGAQPPPNGDYDDDYKLTLKERDVPEGSFYNVGVSERKVAAATGFKYAPTTSCTAPQSISAPIRAPYWVSFAQLNAGVVSRNISLFAIHGPKTPEGSAAISKS